MEYYDRKLCISARELISSGIISESNYKALSSRGKIEIARPGKGLGSYALVVVDSIPDRIRFIVLEKYPEAPTMRLQHWFDENYTLDQAAVAFFTNPEKCGIELPEATIKEYVTNASVLNACIRLYNHPHDIDRTMGGWSWDKVSGTVAHYRQKYKHTLPESMLRFRKAVNRYQQQGYASLISGKFGNQNKRKVDAKTRRIILGLAAKSNNPFATQVWEEYNAFVTGELNVYDPETGELFQPEEYTDKSGAPLELSLATVRNILNEPQNKLLLAKLHSKWSTFMHEQRPHVHRHGGNYSLSEITMDDRDLPRLMKGHERVHAYYAYDVVSGCVVGASYSYKKDHTLVVDCFRDMFRTIEKNGWGMPAGVQVENHLMKEYEDGFLQAGVAFPFVRFCAPLNSQEKYAEQLNGAKKRRIEHRNHDGVGRWYGKGNWRVEYDKVSDDKNDTYKAKKYYTFEELVADDRRDWREWNDTLHHDQKKFPGMTRRQVLEQCVNPNLEPLSKMTLARYIGECRETSIRRNSVVRVDYEKWWLSHTKVLELLQPNNYKVQAYYLPDDEGRATEVYIYQNGRYIDKLEKVETYTNVMAEQTDEDIIKQIEQNKKISSFDKYMRTNAIAPLETEEQRVMPEAVEVAVAVREAPPEDDYLTYAAGIDYSALGKRSV